MRGRAEGGPAEASCLALSPLVAPGTSRPTEGRYWTGFNRTLFTVEEGPAPVTVAFGCHFAKRKNASVVN